VTRVEIQHISVRYGPLWAVREVSLEVEPGELFFLLGPSGCGKTTLLRAVAGLTRPAMGEVLFSGRPMVTVPVHERNVGFVFQNYALWPHLTVAQNVAYGLVTRKVDRETIDSRVEAALSMLGLLGFELRRPAELSGGQQQRVAVARAVVIEPDVLLMDEPLSNLDARLRAEMRRELKALIRRLGVTTIYVTHDQREALSMADRVAVMDDGVVVQVGAPHEIYNHPLNEFVASFVGDANILDAKVTGRTEGGFNAKALGAPLRVAGGSDLRRGDVARLLIRPEDVAAGVGIEGDNILAGRVVDVAFLGGFEEILVELSGGLRVRGRRRHVPGQPFKPGEEIEIAFPADRVKFFKVEEEDEEENAE
jgi:iron(III) transport system ATP-binding protein